VVSWLSGKSILHINKVSHHLAWLILRWVTIHMYIVSVSPLRPTQPSTLCGLEMSTGQGTVCGWEGNHWCDVTLTLHHRLSA